MKGIILLLVACGRLAGVVVRCTCCWLFIFGRESSPRQDQKKKRKERATDGVGQHIPLLNCGYRKFSPLQSTRTEKQPNLTRSGMLESLIIQS